jgi:hypothetical protein
MGKIGPSVDVHSQGGASIHTMPQSLTTTTTSDLALQLQLTAMSSATRTHEARAIVNESPSVIPTGSIGNQNENGVTVNIVGIGG